MMKWVWLLALVASVSADTVRLNDDTVLTGDILAETETNLTLEVELAQGTILKTRVVAKSDVASFTRWTPEQKRVVTMQRAYLALSKYAPNADTSLSVAAYDQAIVAIQNFLTTYPGSSYEQDVTDRLTQLQSERKQVAAGMVKLDGAWLSKEESEKRQVRAKSQVLAKQASDALAAKQWPQAVRFYDALLALHPGGVTEALANRQVSEALAAWRAELEPQLKQLEPELAAAQQRFDRAQQARATRAPPASLNQSAGDGKLGSGLSSEAMRAQADFTPAETHLKTLQAQAERMRGQLATIDQRLAESAPATTPAPASPAADTAAPSGDVLEATASWWQKYWMLFVGIALVTLWLLSRVASR